MSRNVDRLVTRLAEIGVIFPDGDPERAHHHTAGELPETWLVRHHRRALSSLVTWSCAGVTGPDVVLDDSPPELLAAKNLVAYVQTTHMGGHSYADSRLRIGTLERVRKYHGVRILAPKREAVSA